MLCFVWSPLRTVGLRLPVLRADGSSPVQPQLSRLSPPWNGLIWWLEMGEAVRCGKLVAGGCVLAPMLPIWCPSLQGFRSRMGGRKKEKSNVYERRARVHERLAWWHSCHSALSRLSFPSSSHSFLPVVLLSIPSLSLFQHCCLFAPLSTLLSLRSDPFILLTSSSSDTSFLLSPCNLTAALLLLSFSHFHCLLLQIQVASKLHQVESSSPSS